jgi:putative addiction module killer protein
MYPETWVDQRAQSWQLIRCGQQATIPHVEVRKTEAFARWLDGLRDVHARARVQARIERLIAGNPGDTKPVGEGVAELRIDYGSGYQVYFKRRGHELIILLAGGDKRRQARDIQNALRMARNIAE